MHYLHGRGSNAYFNIYIDAYIFKQLIFFVIRRFPRIMEDEKTLQHQKNVNRCYCHTKVFLVENWNSDCTQKMYNEFVDTKCSCIFYQRQ